MSDQPIEGNVRPRQAAPMSDQPEFGQITCEMEPGTDFEHTDLVHFTITMTFPPDDWPVSGVPKLT